MPTSYEKDLKYLLQINGEQSSYQNSVKALIVELKKYESNVPTRYWAKAEVEFVDDLMNMLIPIYKENLSHDDIKAMINFYQTTAGKKIAKKLPKIATESTQAGMSWGQSISEKIRADIESKGYKIRLPFTP